MMPDKFYVPWIDIDPSLAHGGIDGELAPYFVAPDLGDNPTTKNPDMVRIFNEIRNSAQSVSMAPESMKQGYPGRRIVEETLRAMNTVMEKIIDVTHTNATRFHAWSHALPPSMHFPMAPIRYPLRQEFAHNFIHYCLGTLVETAELNRNANHNGLDPQAADILIAPFYNWKATTMKYYFDLEVAGEISREEMNSMFSGKYRPGPTVSPPDESAERPSLEDSVEALSGIDVLQWYPTQLDWNTFGRLADERYVPERIFQPEGAMSTTEDVASEFNVDVNGVPIIGGAVAQQP